MTRVKNYASIPWREREILRYAGVRGEAPAEVKELLESCLEEMKGRLTYRVCFEEYPIEVLGESLDLGFARIISRDLGKNLKDCTDVVVFGATVGVEADRLIARYSRTAPARALMFQAIGAEGIESLCDAFQKELGEEKAAQGRILMPRFSPGYGDVPLSLQREIFRVLDLPRRIGLTLNESLLMSPTKSVTAIIGIK